ncbi:MAG: hypothetical protein J4G12_10275 [Gemmatimonadetes bacterium]|nr:hypothetical protein [Gemmatimonadota bacterium]
MSGAWTEYVTYEAARLLIESLDGDQYPVRGRAVKYCADCRRIHDAPPRRDGA